MFKPGIYVRRGHDLMTFIEHDYHNNSCVYEPHETRKIVYDNAKIVTSPNLYKWDYNVTVIVDDGKHKFTINKNTKLHDIQKYIDLDIIRTDNYCTIRSEDYSEDSDDSIKCVCKDSEDSNDSENSEDLNEYRLVIYDTILEINLYADKLDITVSLTNDFTNCRCDKCKK